MATKAVAKVAGGVMPISHKQTVQSIGIWDRIRRAFAVDPNRSNGVPLNPYYRNPTPGGLDPLGYDDPVTIPAGDIADNAYWRRDSRRAYPKLSSVTQADAAALLTVGSAAAPKQELVGEAGQKQLVAAREEGKTGGLAAYFEKNNGAAKETLFVNGLPPLPSGESLKKDDGTWETYKYKLTEQNTYPDVDKYPCRTFE
ncbi:21 kDa subunit of NADH dehydrogenase [Jackrogersella minutella]|nr:21 kDa subunit of NADH dehydrogenase [Jackrogersella minutella]